MELTLATCNCTGLYTDRTAFIQDFIINNNVDILFLQEMWLYENDFKYVNMIIKEFLSNNVSGIRDSEMIYTRGYEGVSILWAKSLAQRIKPLKSNLKRLVCAEFKMNDNCSILLINAYMPNDNYKKTVVDEVFENEVDNIIQLCSKYHQVNSVMIVGDLNIDLSRNNAHTKRTKDIVHMYNLTFATNHTIAN